jgi:hypothetical protein
VSFKYLLSIQIPTTSERFFQCKHLETTLLDQRERYQLQYLVNIITDDRGKEIPIGQKRNDMYHRDDCGEYCLQVDSDDTLTGVALPQLVIALAERPDCVTYHESIDIDGRMQLANHSIQYENWADDRGGFDYVRTPYMKDVIRTDIARAVPVPPVRYAEDHLWSIALKPFLSNEVHLDWVIYNYIKRSTDETERYGLNL